MAATIELKETREHHSVFVITLPKAALQALAASAERKTMQLSSGLKDCAERRVSTRGALKR